MEKVCMSTTVWLLSLVGSVMAVGAVVCAKAAHAEARIVRRHTQGRSHPTQTKAWMGHPQRDVPPLKGLRDRELAGTQDFRHGLQVVSLFELVLVQRKGYPLPPVYPQNLESIESC